MRRMIVTRAQREAVYRLFARYYSGLETERIAGRTPDKLPRWPGLAERLLPSRAWYSLYRQYRKRFQVSGFGSDLYLFGQPYTQGDGQLWVGIETDGYTHS